MAKEAIQAKAIVLKEVAYKETDKLLTLLSRELGKITVRCRGVRSLKSRRFAACQQYVYSDMTLSVKNGQYALEEAEPIESFFSLRERFEAIALANYFADVLLSVTVEGENDEGVLSLFLNCLYLLSEKRDVPYSKIKAVFELRLATLLGFMPDTAVCGDCEGKDCLIWFNIAGGNLLCDKCATSEVPDVSERLLVPIDEGTLALVRYISEALDKRIFSFQCENGLLDSLSRFSEKYLLYHLGRSFDTLTFYHTISDERI
ncbi:MAG: DNA repair protein RecO [Clostridia bacterium]|nr:DNA repair protein RecO [Clostridia bacterium]